MAFSLIERTDSTEERTAVEAPVGLEPADPFVGPEWIGRYALHGDRRKRRVSTRSRARRRLQRRTGGLLVCIGGLLVATAAWVLITGWMARGELTAMKSELTILRADISAGNITAADNVAAKIAQHAHRAHELTTGPAWWAASQVPGVGAPAETVRGVSAAADALGTKTLGPLITVSAAIDPNKLTLHDHSINLTPLVRATPQLDAAVAAADTQQHAVAKLPSDTWLPAVNSAVLSVRTDLAQLTSSLDAIGQVAHAAPTMLGYASPQRYFVAFQNEAESRGTGGLPGAFGILVADHGTLTFSQFESDDYLDGVTSGLTFGPDYDSAWGAFDPTGQYLNSSVDPDFSYAGQIWAAMWERKTGQHIDGAISLDPTALSYLLKVTGPTTLPDGSVLSSSNVVALTQSTVYAKFDDDDAARKAYLLTLAKAADKRLLDGASNPKGLFDAAREAADERRLLIWDRDATVESLLSGAPISGAVPITKSPYVGPVVINYSANKLNYYQHTTVAWTSTGCGGTRTVTVTVTLKNSAPAHLPSYVTTRVNDPPYSLAAGDSLVMLYYIGTTDGQLQRMSIDGAPASPRTGTTAGHPTYAALVELPRGSTRTVMLHLTEPSATTAPVVLKQPMVNPVQIMTKSSSC